MCFWVTRAEGFRLYGDGWDRDEPMWNKMKWRV